MRSHLKRCSKIALVVFVATAAACAVGCTTKSEDEEVVGDDESDLTERLPPAGPNSVLDVEEAAFVKSVNDHRKDKRLQPLKVAIGLVNAARKHSKELADLNVDATHNDHGRGDQGALRNQALAAARARINADYPFDAWDWGSTPGSSWGEDCARRDNIGAGTAAFALMRQNLAETRVPWDANYDGRNDTTVLRPGFGEVGMPMDEAPSPNMLATYYSAFGVARARSSTGVWYWTVTYGGYGAPYAPMLSLDETAEQSLLTNGSFEAPATNEFTREPSIGTGTWSHPERWYGRDEYFDPTNPDKTDYRVMEKWHVYAGGGGSAAVRTDNAYFDASGARSAHGMRIVDSPAANASTSATQLVKALPGINYEVSARARKVPPAVGEVASDGSQSLYLDFLDAQYKRIGATTVNGGSSPAWTGDPIKVSATAPPRTAFIRIILFGSGGAGKGSTYDWDDVRLRAW